MARQPIIIIGNVGTGKSTLLRGLRTTPGVEIVAADEFYVTNPFFALSKTDPARWCFTNDLWFLKQRAELTKSVIAQTKAEQVVIDSGVLMSYVYAYTHFAAGMLTEQEWQFFEELFTHFTQTIPQPRGIIWLTATHAVMRERIAARNRQFETDYDDYLKSIQLAINVLLNKMKAIGVTVITIDTTAIWPKQVTKEARAAIQQLIS